MTKIAGKPPANPLYEKDFHDWAMEQAVLLRAKRWQDLDLENLAEEVEDMALSQKKEIRSRLEVLIMHLLKWKYQPGRRIPSCKNTVFNQRHGLDELIEDMPSLRPYLRETFPNRYNAARLSAEALLSFCFLTNALSLWNRLWTLNSIQMSPACIPRRTNSHEHYIAGHHP